MSEKKAKQIGHADHTKDAAARGLQGQILRPIKITMLGAGSAFTPRLMNDILRIPGDKGGTIALVDIDRERLDTMVKLITRLAQQIGKPNWQVVGSVDRRKVMADSDYIVNCIEVSGTACVRFDNDIPATYGIDQCIGDTIGPGGLFKSMRTIPVFLQVLKDAEELCPKAIVLNYTNPMAMMCLAAGRSSSMQIVGLCHSVQGTSHLLAERAGVPVHEMEWECAGINHMAWFTKLEHNGRDLYPILKRKAANEVTRALKEGRAKDPKRLNHWQWEAPAWHRDIVRKDMMLHFGAFITESSGHLSEYLPYYRKRKDLIQRYSREGYDGGTSFYADNWPTWRKDADKQRGRMLAGKEPMEWARSWEYASWIIEAREKDAPFRIHGNVMNNIAGAGQLITNLPADGCVEVACMVDRNGINPTRYGALPRQMAALCDSNMRMFDLGAQACIERSKELAIYALMLDPLTSAVCSPEEIKKMTLEMFAAEKAYLPGYR
ncbi:MAG: glycoside hydrolase [Verrucomicrobia bacterium]|nr:glycoside hydrolase [Verrucomicrobiota bacterium]